MVLPKYQQPQRKVYAGGSMHAQEDHTTCSDSLPDVAITAAAGDVYMSEEQRVGDTEQALDVPAAELPPVHISSAGAMGSGAGDAFLTDALLFLLEEDAELLMLDGVSDDAIDLGDLNFSDCVGGFSDDNDASQGQQSECLGDARSAGGIGHVPSNAEASTSQPLVGMKMNPKPPLRMGKPRVIRPAGPVTTRPACSAGTIQMEGARTTGRKRVKDELEYLRQHVNDLEEQLQQLHPSFHRHPEKQEIPPSQLQQFTYNGESDRMSAVLSIVSSDSTSSSSLMSSDSSLWKRVATHQMDERRKVETENARLRDLLEAQLRLARSLARTLRKRPNLTELNPHQLNSEVTWLRFNPRNTDTASIYAHLEESIVPLYARVDAVLAESGFAAAKKEVREGHVERDASSRLQLRVVDSNIVPFDLKTTSSGFWKLFSSVAAMDLNGGVYKATDATRDTIRAQFSASLRLRGAEAILDAHLLGKQVIEENRVVIVWSTLGKSEGDLFGSERIVIRETGWTVIEEVAPSVHSGSERSPSTIIQTIVQMTPQLEEKRDGDSAGSHQKMRPSHIGVLTDLVLSSFNQNLESMHQMIENIILTEIAQTQ